MKKERRRKRDSKVRFFFNWGHVSETFIIEIIAVIQ